MSMTSLIRRLTPIAASLSLALPGLAADALDLPSFFSNGMVLQRDQPLKIWGWGPKDSEVSVTFAGQSVTTRIADDRWDVVLDPLPANATGQVLVVASGSTRVEIEDVLIGDVWLCGGQSNMEWRLRSSRDADIELPAADYPGLRYFRIEPEGVPEPRSDIPVSDTAGIWQACTPETAGDCSGVAYYFGRRLHRNLGVPVGLINAAWGGTMAQHWVTRETLDTLPTMKPFIEEYEQKRADWIEGGGIEGAKRRYEADLAAWEQAAAKAKAAGEKAPGKPNFKNYGDPATGRIPAGPLNAMIMPLAGLPIRGALFYQGENNSFGETWVPFQETFPAVIADWRRLFGNDDLPFGIIQIAGWSTRRSMTYDMNHHTNVVREIQFNTWRSTPNTGLVVSFDANSDANIHPRRKMPVGERSARWALSQVYGAKDATNPNLPLDWHGPVYRAMEKGDGRIKVVFEKDGAQGLRLDKADVRGFYIAGADREFHHAEARVVDANGDNPSVEVWSSDVTEPVAVRYAVSNLPIGSLMNGRELPAFPFRTDDWPIKPHHGEAVYQVTR
jgi:sialate O-acetylesterase